MPLSRLDNFLKNVRGNIIYVNPNDLDATDAVENQGNSLGRPFITIQRALIEAARFSYQQGLDNDRFGKTTVILYPGEHVVDNRPGLIPDDSVSPIRYIERQGTTTLDFPPFSTTSDFDLSSTNNILHDDFFNIITASTDLSGFYFHLFEVILIKLIVRSFFP